MPKMTPDRIVPLVTDREQWQNVSVNLSVEGLASMLNTARDGEPMRLFKLAEEIYRKDPDIFQAVQTRSSSITNLGWTVEGDPRVEKFLRGMRGDPSAGVKDFNQLIASMVGSTYLTGIRVNEILFGPTGLPIGFNQIPGYFLTFWETYYMPRLWTLAAQPDGERFTREKVVVHYHDVTVEDYSNGALIQCLAWLYLFKTLNFKASLSFAERYGMPFLLIKVEGQGDGYDKDLDNARRVIQGLGVPGGVFRDGVEMSFVDSGSTSSDGSFFETQQVGLSKAIQKVVLGQTSSADSVDSNRSTAAEHMKVVEKYRRDDAQGIENTINDQLIPIVSAALRASGDAKFTFDIVEAQEEEDADLEVPE